MKSTSHINGLKKLYVQPEIEHVVMDNEISLQLESAAPAPPGDPVSDSMVPGFVNQNPFKDFQS